MKIKKSRSHIVALTAALNQVQNLEGFKICYAVAKSANMLQPVIKDVQTAELQLKDYREARNKVIQKSNDGEAKDADKLQKELSAVDEKHKKVIDAFEEFMAEEIEVEVHEVAEENVPENITIDQMRAVEPLIKPEE